MSAVMAEREMTLTGGGKGFVRIHQPEPDDRCWTCKIHMSWDGADKVQHIHGEDGYQALLLAIQMIPVFVALTPAYQDGRLKVFDNILRDRDPRDPHNRTNLEQFFEVRSQFGGVQ